MKDYITVASFLDLSKAFDTVDHQTLLRKLECNFGIRGCALEVMKSYLNNRFQYSKINKSASTLTQINCGVPQGSSLSPLLFLLYINDLPLASNFSTTLFADDTHLNMSDNNLNSLEKRVNDVLAKIEQWFKKNKLSLNYKKSCCVLVNKQPQITINENFRININDNPILRTNSAKYLGLFIDENLSWSSHVKSCHCSLQNVLEYFIN